MMIYYIVFFLLCILSIINPKNKFIKKIILIFLGIFLCGTYFNGSDWRNYELDYFYVNNFMDLMTYKREKGFYIYMFIFKKLGFNFWSFFIITKFWCLYIFYKIIDKNSENLYLNLMFFYGSFGLLYLFVDCPLRNLISISLVLFGISYLLENKKWRYIILVILAGTVHNTGFFFLVLIVLKKCTNISTKKLAIFCFLIFFFFTFKENLIFISQKLPFFEKRLSYYLSHEKLGNGKIISLGSLEKIIFLIVFIFKRKEIKDKKIYILGILYILLYRIALTLPILFRMYSYVYIFYSMNIVEITMKRRKNLRYFLIIVYIFYNGMTLSKNMYRDIILYLPYTNYFCYLFEEKPSYNIRDRYNFNYILEYYGREQLENILKRRKN